MNFFPSLQIQKLREPYITFYMASAAFLTYALMYAFRKPFAAATYDQIKPIWGIPYKDLLVVLQLLGYSMSKLLGIKFIAELLPQRRGRLMILLIFISWGALFAFAIIPPPWNVICLFINGIPLGWIWGITFSYVEGRITSDFIGTMLAVSFIFSSGLVKSFGKYLLTDWHIPDLWMPFVAGGFAIIPMGIMIYLLSQSPPPSVKDQQVRVKRVAMYEKDRHIFLNEFGFGIILLIIIYTCLTLFRDIRDNFMAELWVEIYHNTNFNADLFTATETPIALLLLFFMSVLVFIKSNQRAFQLAGMFVECGFFLTAVSSWLFMHQHISGFYWISLTGIGLYMGYIPFNCVLYDRMIAYLGMPANVGFLMYLSDAFGYLASLLVITTKALMAAQIKWTIFYSQGVWWCSLLGMLLTILAWHYFLRKPKYIFGAHA